MVAPASSMHLLLEVFYAIRDVLRLFVVKVYKIGSSSQLGQFQVRHW
jgi:hypothetical protein